MQKPGDREKKRLFWRTTVPRKHRNNKDPWGGQERSIDRHSLEPEVPQSTLWAEPTKGSGKLGGGGPPPKGLDWMLGEKHEKKKSLKGICPPALRARKKGHFIGKGHWEQKDCKRTAVSNPEVGSRPRERIEKKCKIPL